MSRMKKGNGLLRFLISAVFFALVLSGCNGTRKYEAVDLSSETAAAESESGSGEEQGTENSDEADLQALGNPAGETMSADQAAESSQDAESVSESEEMASEMSEEESVAAARESALIQPRRTMTRRLLRKFRLTDIPSRLMRDTRRKPILPRSRLARPLRR